MRGGGNTSTIERLEFTYTGQYNERLEDGVVELLTDGVLKFKKETPIDAFLVGGGSSGSSGRTEKYNANTYGAGGGAGGYTKTLINIVPRVNQDYQIVIGSGGVQQSNNLSVGNAGGDTSAFGATANGGGVFETTQTIYKWAGGAPGGSGGGQGGETQNATRDGFYGGNDGSDGIYNDARYKSTGQGTTTREFGESTGKIYAGGGGGGSSIYGAGSSNGGVGGDGGGGNGAGYSANATAGAPNTGGGGGGGAGNTSDIGVERGIGAAGGSGIVCIRLHKEVQGLEFTYTGDYIEREEDGVVELLSSGNITFPR